jgi:hypothetical protein
MENEIWKQCGESKRCIYEVSNMGNVRSVWSNKERFIKGSPDKDGYLRTRIKQKSVRIHTLVITTFLGPRPDGMIIDHIDRNRQNNRLDNLRYCSVQINSRNTERFRTDILEQDIKDRRKIMQKQNLAIKINCPCGSITSKAKISRHEKTEKHKKYLNSLL